MKRLWFSQKNEPVSAWIHLLGLFFSIIGFVILMVFTKEHGTLLHLIGFIIFGVSLIFLYLVSTVYHFFPRFSRFKKILQRMDHMMIYIFMGSSYTPICLTIDNRACGWGLLAVAWGFALTGVIVKGLDLQMKEWASVLMYVVFGLLLVSATGPLLQWLPQKGVGWMYGGGFLYLFGVIFYLLEDYGPRKIKAGLHETWHVFVVAGSYCHAWLMLKYVLYI
ncbi:hemolysin III family protein [Desulfoluna sp.]|uniref:PAQR family membrane homeostasis protein TrhA n=1 Tax=Desulfoluna sp. TaxID=2045199 RepID=UPI0026270B33|nr:hemolysin III family protein [Desulfoluna sp.]